MTEDEYNNLLDEFHATLHTIGFHYAVNEAFNNVYHQLYELSKLVSAIKENQECPKLKNK